MNAPGNRKKIIFELYAEVKDLEWVLEMIMSDYPLDEIIDKIMKRKRAYEKQAGLERRYWREQLIKARDALRQKKEGLR